MGREAPGLVWITTVDAAGKPAQLGVTPEHPLYVADLGWTAAGEVAAGDALRDRVGRALTVVTVGRDENPARVHNLEVAGAATYFAGEQEAWAHNAKLGNGCGCSIVYRVFGNTAKLFSRSWTTVDPRTVSGFRNAAGLPSSNAGKYLAIGELVDTTGVAGRASLPIGEMKGGLPEKIIPDPRKQVNIRNVCRLTPRL